MEENNTLVAEMMDTLVDWFETIEEVELTDASKAKLYEVAESIATSKEMGMQMGVQPEVFDEWLQSDVLEQWSALLEDMEEMDEMADPVQLFYGFAKEGEQRLYLQMLKQCMLISESQSA